jgi:hypothetical protein
VARFLSLGFGDVLINADRIDKIERDEGRRSRAILNDGGSVMVQDAIDVVERSLLPVVAASPGYTLLRFFGGLGTRGPNGECLPHAGEDNPYVERLPIVAWRIDDSHARPVTPHDDDDAISNLIGSGVLLPDGQVAVPFTGTFENEAAWQAEMSLWASWRKLRVVK